MADTTKKDDKPTSEPEPKARDKDELETTTTNDGSIAINQSVPKEEAKAEVKPVDAKPAEPVEAAKVTPPSETVAPAEDSMVQAPSSATPEAPIVVSEADVAAASKEADPHESLSEQIEVLTGEVQALEAKIEKLTSGVGENAVTPTTPEAPEEPTPAPEAPKAEPEPTKDEPKAEEPKNDGPIPVTAPIEAFTKTADVPAATTSISAASNEGAKPIDDVYNKILSGPQQGQTPPADGRKDLNDDASIDEGTTGLGTIGEALIVFGLIALLILGASPFFKSTVGTNWEALKSIGWPTATISLFLGFILFLFNKGRVVFKIFALLLFIVAAVMTAAIFDYGSMLGPLGNMLAPIASFYK